MVYCQSSIVLSMTFTAAWTVPVVALQIFHRVRCQAEMDRSQHHRYDVEWFDVVSMIDDR